MRLTLRTLLAYLDGLLPAEQRSELDAKVAGSPVAPQLIERIRGVVARPGLAAPRTDGRGLAEDANTVAGFLDNALLADRLEAFERICIDSDIHLAETADCHAILAELAADASLIQPLDRATGRRILLEVVGHLGEPVHDTDHADSLAVVRQVRKAMAAPARSPAGRATSPWRASLAAWLSALVAVSLLALVGGLLVRSLWTSPPQPQELAEGRPADVATETGEDSGPAPPGEAEGLASDEAAPAAEDRPDRGEPNATSDDVSDAPPSEEPAADAGGVSLPMMEAAIEGPLEPEPPADQPPPEASPPPAAAILADGGLMLRRAAAAGSRWERLPPGEPLAASEQFVVPVHSFPMIVIGPLRVRFLPSTFGSVRTDPDGSPRLEIVFGGAVAWSDAAETPLGIIAGGLTGRVAVGPRQPLGIAVELLRSPGDDPAVTAPGQRATIFTAGGTRWQQTEFDGGPPGILLAGIDRDQPLPRGTGLVWTSADPGAARLIPAGREPEWMREVTAGGTGRAWTNWAARALEVRLAAGGPAVETLRQMAADRRPENRLAAAATLALLGEYDELVGLLCEDRPGQMLRESQWETLEASVQQALARGANAAAKLRQAFAAKGPAGRGDELSELACGVAPGAISPARAAVLLDGLSDPLLVVRRYAFKNLQAAFPEELAAARGYAPDRSPLLNEDAVTRWRRAVESAAAAAPP